MTGAVIVAAGLSSRMHDFKPMMPFGDSTISRHNVTMLKSLGLDPIIVVTGYRSEELQQHLAATGVRCIKNEDYATTQMFDSIKIGLQAISEECDRVLVMPMDIPGIQPETFRKVLEIDAPIVRTRCNGKAGHPIILRSDVAKSFLDYNGENGLKGAIRSYEVPPVDVEVLDEGVHMDVDTPEDYKKLVDKLN